MLPSGPVGNYNPDWYVGVDLDFSLRAHVLNHLWSVSFSFVDTIMCAIADLFELIESLHTNLKTIGLDWSHVEQ